MSHQTWIEQGLKKGIEDLQVYSSRSKSLKISLYQGRIDQFVQSDVEKITLTGIYQGKITRVVFENTTETNVDTMLDRLIQNASALTAVEPAIIYPGSETYPEVDRTQFDFTQVPAEAKIKLVNDLESNLLGQDHVKQVQTTVYQENADITTIVNSKGLDLSRSNSYAYAYAVGVFEKDDDIKTAYEIELVKTFEAFDAHQMAQKTLEKGWAKLGGTSVPSKAYPVVFSNEMFGNLLAAFTTLFSGESAYRNLTPLKDKVNQKIAIEGLDVIDDPLHKDAYFQVPFDDEGVAAFRMPIIEKGVFKGFMHDLKTAAIFNEKPNGHSFGGRISPSNLYVKPSNVSFDALIAPIEDGIYITELAGLHSGVKAVSGEFSLQSGGFRIENGKVTTPVKMIVLSGNFFTLLKTIEGLGSDLKFGLNGIGSPSVHVASLAIGGE